MQLSSFENITEDDIVFQPPRSLKYQTVKSNMKE